MANHVERSCSMLVYSDRPASASEIKEALEGNDPNAKIEAMQKAISMLLNGEQLPALFITIVRYVLPSEDHTVQKLLLLYLVSWSISKPPPRGYAHSHASAVCLLLERPSSYMHHAPPLYSK